MVTLPWAGLTHAGGVIGGGRTLSSLPTRMLLATDGSPHAELAAKRAIDLARSTGSKLHIVVVGRTFPQAVYEFYTETEAGREDLRREAREVLDEQVRKIELAGGDVAVAHLKFGESQDEAIVHLAEEIGAERIVIGSPGFGRLRSALVGDVADSVARRAPCPVTVVRAARRAGERPSLLRRLTPSNFVGSS